MKSRKHHQTNDDTRIIIKFTGELALVTFLTTNIGYSRFRNSEITDQCI